jgi:hypothetical protein
LGYLPFGKVGILRNVAVLDTTKNNPAAVPPPGIESVPP